MAFGDLVPYGVGFVVVAVVLGFGVLILGEIEPELSADGQLVTGNATNGILKFAKFLPLMAVAIVAGIVIGLVVKEIGGQNR